MSRVFRDLSGWLVVLGLIYIPWHNGGVAPISGLILFAIVASATFAWGVSAFSAGNKPRIPMILVLCIAWLLFQGWWMVFNANHSYDPSLHRFFQTEAFFPQFPGSMDAAVSATSALNMSSFLAILCIAVDLGRERKWHRRLWLTPILTGVLVAAHGMLGRTSAEVLGISHALKEGFPFGVFSNHGNAGAFLNFCLPGSITLACVLCRTRVPVALKVLAVCFAVVLLLAVISNSSKASQAIGSLVAGGTLGWCLVIKPQENPPRARRGRVYGRLAIAIALSFGVGVIAIAMTWQRWSVLPTQMNSKNPRLLMWRVCAELIENAGALGHGPGTYKLMYPLVPKELLEDLYPRWIVRHHTPGEAVSIWSHVHNDYLQFIAEWGWAGFGAWMVILMGATFHSFRTAGWSTSASLSDRMITASIGIALTGLLFHAMLDFPLQILSIQAFAATYLGLAWGAASSQARCVGHIDCV
jgi:O-antigen ligase